MSLSPLKTLKTSRRGLSARAAALFASAALAVTPVPAVMSSSAQASDLDFSSVSTPDDGNFLRIGLNKSAVIKLPAAAKDVIVGDPQVVDVVLRNRTTAYLFARNPAQTNVFFFDANGQQILNLDLEVTIDAKALKKLIDRTIPGNSIQVDTSGKNVVLKGTALSAQESKMAEDLITNAATSQCDCQVVNTLRIAEGDQVMLKVKVVELKRSILKQLGVNLSGSFSVGEFDIGFNSAPTLLNEDSALDAFGAFTGTDATADVEIRALEQEGLATILAEPTLTAISGAAARFHAGGEYPYSVCRAVENGIRECDIEFKPFGISLDFTPTVLTEGRIGLNIRTEVSELSQISNGTVPAIDTRNAQTTVEIPSGGSMMLAGLIKDVTAQDLSGTPGLRKLPILGALFNSRAYQSNQSELVVIVTPYIVNPTSRHKLATPIDRFNAATDKQSLLFGRLNKVYGTAGKSPNGVYHGNVGYIIE